MENRNLRILAIDDCADNLTALEAVLEDALPGARVFTALSGSQGLEQALGADPDVILLDIVMPGMDGFEVCRKLKEDERLRAIPVVFLTSLKGDHASQNKALAAGAEGFLSKPFEEGELIAQIRAMAKIKAAHDLKRLDKTQLAELVAERTRELEQELAERHKVEQELKDAIRELKSSQIATLNLTEDLRKKIEAQKQSERFSQATIDSLSTHLCVLDETGTILSVNRAWRNFAVANPPAPGQIYEGANYLKVCDAVAGPETGEARRFAAGIRAVMNRGRDEFAMEYPCHSPSEHRWFIGRVTRFQGEGPTRLVVAHENITERKQIEEVQAFLAQTGSRATSEPFFHTLARYLAQSLQMDFVCIDRLEGNGLTAMTVAVWCDGHFEDNVTYALKDTPCGDVVGKTVCCFPASVCQFFPRDQVLQELRAQSYVGVTLWSHTGQPIGLIAVIGRSPLANRALAEVTLKLVVSRAAGELERQQAEDALRASEQRFRSYFDLPLIGIAITSPEKGWLEVNDQLCETLGYSREQLLGMTWAELTHPEDLDADVASFNRVLAREVDGYRLEKRFIRADGRVMISELAVRCVRNSTGEVDYFVALMQDITGRKRAEAEKEKLEVQNRQLQKSESLGRMAGSIAHHFNNQLQAVMMNLEMAMKDPHRDAGPVENLTEAMRAARKAAEVSRLMLTYLGQTDAKREPLDLSDVCQRYVPLLRASMPQSVVLETDWPSSGPTISANASQIQQVLNNLVTNAWEAMGDTRSAIHLTIKTVPAVDIPATHRFPSDWQPQDPAYGCLEVMDTGCGIPAREFEKIFDPFFSTKFTGRGMGLAVVLGIVRSYQGGITMESKPGRGCIFRIFLPLSTGAVSRKPVPMTQAPQTAGSGTVLVVDDETSLRLALATAIKRLGFSVLAAKDGVEALEIFQQHRDDICCVLCDLSMPRMNGWETLAALRQLAPSVPVILSSGYGEAQMMEGHHPEVPQAFLSKPYEYVELIGAIRQVLAGRHDSAKASVEVEGHP